MDTDSFVYQFKTHDFYKDIASDVKARFDTSNYPKAKKGDVDYRPLDIGENKKVISLMKDELGGKIMTEFVALRAKLYAYKKLDDSEDKRCKGVKKCVVKKTITFDDYKECLEKGKTVYREQVLFENNKHIVYTKKSNKIALTRDDDKRKICDDLISTKARGYVASAA